MLQGRFRNDTCALKGHMQTSTSSNSSLPPTSTPSPSFHCVIYFSSSYFSRFLSFYLFCEWFSFSLEFSIVLLFLFSLFFFFFLLPHKFHNFLVFHPFLSSLSFLFPLCLPVRLFRSFASCSLFRPTLIFSIRIDTLKDEPKIIGNYCKMQSRCELNPLSNLQRRCTRCFQENGII